MSDRKFCMEINTGPAPNLSIKGILSVIEEYKMFYPTTRTDEEIYEMLKTNSDSLSFYSSSERCWKWFGRNIGLLIIMSELSGPHWGE